MLIKQTSILKDHQFVPDLWPSIEILYSRTNHSNMFADELKFFCIKQFDPDLDHVTWIYTVMITGIYPLVATTVNMINIKQMIHKVSGDNTWYAVWPYDLGIHREYQL